MFSAIIRQLMVNFWSKQKMLFMEEDRAKRRKAFVAISSSVALTEESLRIHMLKALMHKTGNDSRISANIPYYTGL